MATKKKETFDFNAQMEETAKLQQEMLDEIVDFYGKFDFKKSTEDMLKFQEKIVDGVKNIMSFSKEDVAMDQLDKYVVLEIGKMKLYHYKPLVPSKNLSSTPTLVTYALVNRQYMLDLQPDRSVFKNFLENGMDLYAIDWGYPTGEDMYMTLDDYINWYMNECVEYIKKESGAAKINMLGICQGATFTTIYSALYPKNVNAVIALVVPIDFSKNDGLLFRWGKDLNIDSLVDAYGVVPGDVMNFSYLILKPLTLTIHKYVAMVDKMDNPAYMQNFLRMEKWNFDSPGQAGEALRQFIKDLYQDNKLIKGELVIGDKKVNLKKITQPLLVVVGENDHLVPNSSSEPLMDAVGSKDKEYHCFKTGHIGIFTSSKSRTEIMPTIVDWIKAHS